MLNKLCILSFLFLLIPRTAFAFITTSTSALVAATMGPFLWGLIVLASVNLALFFKRIKKRIKLIIRVVSIISLILLTVIGFQRYTHLKYINNIYDDIPLLKYEIDLNNISMKSLSEYTILGVETSAHSLKKFDSIHFNVLELLFANFSEFEQLYSLNKNNKLLVICEMGVMSSNAVNVLRSNGYNAFLARLSRTYNEQFFRKYFTFRKNKPTSSLVVVPYSGEENTVFINYGFIYLHHNLAKKADSIDYKQFRKEQIENKNIVCFSNFHCVMTKYFLDSHGIREQIIYKIPLQDDEYIGEEARLNIVEQSN